MSTPQSFVEYLKAFNTLPRESDNFLQIAVLRSYTCETLEQTLAVTAFNQGLLCKISFGGFNQYHQELLDHSSFLYATNHDAVVFAVMLEDLCPELMLNYYNLAGNIDKFTQDTINNIREMLDIFRSHSNAPIFFCNFIYPYFGPVSSFHSQYSGMRTFVHNVNVKLAEMLHSVPNAFVVDLEMIVYTLGVAAAFDRKMMRLAKNPFTIPVYAGLGRQITALLSGLRGKRKKCIVVDCDDTLWRGVIGEDGMTGIKITEDFQEMHRQLLHWKNSGILLALCSKNNLPDVEEVFNSHPDMRLSLKDFAAMRVNWSDKAENIRQLARELNIGEDSLIFVDDSEFECNLVREVLPMVETVRLSGNPADYPETILNLPGLNFVTLTEEDTRRADMYTEQRQREMLRASQTDLESYLASLEMNLEFSKMDSAKLARAAQLTQKTNQFTVTTKRYTEEDLLRLESEGHMIVLLRAGDRFGDNGWTGLMILDARDPKRWVIDTFLLSCRIMGRTIERAFFGIILELARKHGIDEILGHYIPTPKNKPVESLFQDLGFEKNGDAWRYEVSKEYAMPSYFTCDTVNLPGKP